MHARLLTILPIFALTFTGCAGDWGGASGTVTLDGAPLKDASISFVPVDGGATAYGQVKDGAFALNTGQKDGLKAGKYRVAISASTVPQMGSKDAAKLLTPKKYSSPETSGLEEEVKPGSNSFKFELSSKP